MSARPSGAGSELRGATQLARDAVLGLTDLVEAMHGGIGRPWTAFSRTPPARTRGLTGWVYRCVRWWTRGVGSGLDAALAALAPAFDEPGPSARRDTVVAVLNGVLGDYLAAAGNPLAMSFELRRAGRPLPRPAAALAAAIPEASGRVVVLIHGLCGSDRLWHRPEFDFGAALERDLGVTVVCVRYNSGLHVSTNGRALAEALEELWASWPVTVEELSIVAHSMGGLVARSACHEAGLAGAGWPGRLRRLIFLGTPHHGAPLERGGQWLHRALGATPFARPLARLGRIRSAGITDLRYGNLLEEDWRDRDRFAPGPDSRRIVPLPAGVACYAAAAVRGPDGGRRRRHRPGDGLVPLASALGRHRDPARALAIPPERQWIGRGMSHFDLLRRPEAYAQVRTWLGG